eukprot:scaffold342771_cov34-Prasinocladus_malaysianus.AAC.1
MAFNPDEGNCIGEFRISDWLLTVLYVKIEKIKSELGGAGGLVYLSSTRKGLKETTVYTGSLQDSQTVYT